MGGPAHVQHCSVPNDCELQEVDSCGDCTLHESQRGHYRRQSSLTVRPRVRAASAPPLSKSNLSKKYFMASAARCEQAPQGQPAMCSVIYSGPTPSCGRRVEPADQSLNTPPRTSTAMRLYLLFHMTVAEQTNAATMPSIAPNTTESGPCSEARTPYHQLIGTLLRGTAPLSSCAQQCGGTCAMCQA